MQKTAVFPRSIPGGGKSTLSKLLRKLSEEAGYTAGVHSTDSYFYINGVYTFDTTKIGYFHRLNFEAFCKDLNDGVNLVILDNTNLVLRDFNHYIEYCKIHGYKTVDVTLHPDDIIEHTARNVHQVPAKNIQRMLQKFNIDLNFADVRYDIHPNSFNEDSEIVAKKIIEGMA